VFTSEDFNEAKEILEFFIFDLIILDRMMPTGDGINLIKDIKKASKTPIIMLTAMGENNDKIDGLKTGTDDYLSKPFEPEELFLRINNLLKLYENVNNTELLFSFGNFIYNTKTNSLTLNDKEIYLTEGENNLLLKLINNRNNTLSREQLAEKEFDESELRKVDVGVTRLRQKIEKTPKQPKYIKTIRGQGYMLICKEV
jgi:two-component system phosphate regulon response regulator OmpR